ncbi:MAG: hypothetical protein ACLP2F_02660 [Steroidobacteraceae bacterium]
MQDVSVGSWAPQPHFSNERLGSLRHLNHRFLDLIGAHVGDWRFPGGLKLPGEVSGRVAPLSAAQRALAANCPYALFDLRFHDDEHWRARLSRAGQWRIADEPTVENDAANFVQLALFYAWHVASTTKLVAQLLLGMNEHTAAAFRGVTLDCLPALAASEAVNLTARWCTSNAYWSALVYAASRTDAARLRRVQLFGLQLAAAASLP